MTRPIRRQRPRRSATQAQTAALRGDILKLLLLVAVIAAVWYFGWKTH